MRINTGVTDRVFERGWILSDGKIGDLIGSRGVMEALGVKADERVVAPGPPWEWFFPWGPLPPRDRRRHEDSPIGGPLPPLVIASGRRTLAYLRAVKRAGGDRVFTVYLKDPRSPAAYVDLIWVPAHDARRGGNVVVTLTSPHRFSPQRLRTEFARLPPALAGLPRPLVAVLLGGDSKDFLFNSRDCDRLAGVLGRLAETDRGLAITSSRRTPPQLSAAIRSRLAGLPHFWWDGSGDNPYGYLLAHADYTLVTADSTNMVMEACATGRPVYYFTPTGGSRKIDLMLKSLEIYGALRPLPEESANLADWRYEPLYSADVIADAIRKAAMARGVA